MKESLILYILALALGLAAIVTGAILRHWPAALAGAGVVLLALIGIL